MDFAPHGATRKSNPNQTAFSQAGHEWWPRFPAQLVKNSRFCGRFITPYAFAYAYSKRLSFVAQLAKNLEGLPVEQPENKNKA